MILKWQKRNETDRNAIACPRISTITSTWRCLHAWTLRYTRSSFCMHS